MPPPERNLAAAKAWASGSFQGFVGRLSFRQCEWLKDYQTVNASAEALNALLRDGILDAPGCPAVVRAQASALDGAIAEGRIDEPVVLYRAIRDPAFMGDRASYIGLKIGNKGYTSMSLGTAFPLRLLEGSPAGVLVRVYVPADLNAAYVDLVQDYGEDEILFGRGLQLTIVDDSLDVDENGFRVLTAEARYV